jgi:hypothetical protein
MVTPTVQLLRRMGVRCRYGGAVVKGQSQRAGMVNALTNEAHRELGGQLTIFPL